MRKGYIMQYVIVFFCLAAFYVVGLASLLLHLIREYRQYKTKRQDTSPAVGWQTSTLPGPRPPIVHVERVPTRSVEVSPQDEQPYAVVQAQAYARCLETLLATPDVSEE